MLRVERRPLEWFQANFSILFSQSQEDTVIALPFFSPTHAPCAGGAKRAGASPCVRASIPSFTMVSNSPGSTSRSPRASTTFPTAMYRPMRACFSRWRCLPSRRRSCAFFAAIAAASCCRASLVEVRGVPAAIAMSFMVGRVPGRQHHRLLWWERRPASAIVSVCIHVLHA